MGCTTALVAYIVDISEAPTFDFKEGYCSDGWYLSEKVSSGRKDCCHIGTNTLPEMLP